MEPVPAFAGAVSFQLRAPHDFSFLSEWGSVFRVFDSLASGNVCFGVTSPDGARLFVKYAGAHPLRYPGHPKDAVRKLRAEAQARESLRHAALLPLLFAQEAGEGYLCAVPWYDGVALSPVHEHFRRMRSMDVLSRLRMYDRLVDLHAVAEAVGFSFAGLDDANILIDLFTEGVRLVSASHFFRLPLLNLKGRMPGNPWYLSPEAYLPGQLLDETAAVYTLGALAFTFFGDRTGHTSTGWDGPMRLLEIARRAILRDREKRYQSVRSYQNAWREAVLASRI